PAGSGILLHLFVRNWLAELLMFMAGFLLVMRAVSALDCGAQHPTAQVAPPISTGAFPPPSPRTQRPALPAITTRYVPVLPWSIRTYSTLDAFTSDAQNNVEDYWLNQPFPADRPYVAPRVVLMQAGQPVPCAVGLTQWTSFYCPNERII